jgi:hypothetical protein
VGIDRILWSCWEGPNYRLRKSLDHCGVDSQEAFEVSLVIIDPEPPPPLLVRLVDEQGVKRKVKLHVPCTRGDRFVNDLSHERDDVIG